MTDKVMLDAREIPLARKVAALTFLLVAYFFYAWSWNTVDILRPYIKESLGLTLTQSGSLYTMQSIGAIVGAVVMGRTAGDGFRTADFSTHRAWVFHGLDVPDCGRHLLGPVRA